MIKRIKSFFSDPCEEGYSCPVRMCCVLKKRYPWTKREKCNIYDTYIKRKKILDKCIEYPQVALGFTCFGILPLAWFFTALIWGSWDILKLLYGLIFL